MSSCLELKFYINSINNVYLCSVESLHKQQHSLKNTNKNMIKVLNLLGNAVMLLR